MRKIMAGLITWAFVQAWPLHASNPTPFDWNLVVNVSPATLHTTQPHQPTTEDRIRVLLSGDEMFDCSGLSFGTAVVEGSSIKLLGTLYQTGVHPCTPGEWGSEVTLPPLTEGRYLLEVFSEGSLIHDQRLDVFPPLRALSLGAFGGIRVTVQLTDPRVGAPRAVPAVQLSPIAGYFWFFDPDNVEVTVKIIDARSLTGDHWLFVSGMTDLGFTLTVDPSPDCQGQGCRPSQTYVNQPGRRMNLFGTIP